MAQTNLNRHQATTVVWVLWAAMSFALIAYIVVAEIVAPKASEPPAPRMPQILGAAAIVLAAVSVFMRKKFFSGVKSGALSLDDPAGTKQFVTGNIVCFALSEAIAIFGLVLRFIGHPPESCGGFFVFSMVLLAWHAPLPGRFKPAHDPLLRS